MSILCPSYSYLLCQHVFQESGSHIDFLVCCPGMQLLKHVMQTSYYMFALISVESCQLYLINDTKNLKINQ